ncbi:Ig-like domain-containing protein [Listeria booriae]|uniref:Ig-like domain-containing protein n=1 Tax=Listeria booriae TaxID=1552123 RepID=UPI0016239886|nr:Ig-like domain-containing protein [Listeria booriae]MBC2208003.1 hypothetical protein [Listeria booriae]
MKKKSKVIQKGVIGLLVSGMIPFNDVEVKAASDGLKDGSTFSRTLSDMNRLTTNNTPLIRNIAANVSKGTEKLAINTHYIGATYIRGTAPDAVKVRLSIAGKLIRSVDVAKDHSFKIYANDIAELKTSGTILGITAQNKNGEFSEMVTSEVKELKAPTLNAYRAGQKYIAGTVAEGTSRISLYNKAGVLLRNGQIEADGTFRITANDLPALQVAGDSFTVKAITASGVISDATKGTIEAEVLAAAPTIKGYYLNDTYITGNVSERGVRVFLRVNGRALRGGTIASDGSYRIYANDIVELKRTGATFEVVTQDIDNRYSEVAKNSVQSMPTPKVDLYRAGQTYITGSIQNKATRVGVYDKAGRLLRNGQVYENGTFRIYVSGVPELQIVGDNLIIKTFNADGERNGEVSQTVSKAVDEPTILSVTHNSTEVSGTGLAGANVFIKAGNKEIGTGQVDSNGIYKIAIAKQAVGTKLLVHQERNGVISSAAEITVAKGLEAPEIDRLYIRNDSRISGTGAEGATVIVSVDNQEIGRGEVSQTGKYSVAIPKQEVGTTLSVVQSKDGDTSANKNTKVPVAMVSPTVITSNEVSIRGIARRGFATIRIYNEDNQQIATARAIGSGSFVVSLPKQLPGSKLTLVSIASSYSELESIDLSVIKGLEAPQVNQVTAFHTSVEGVGAPQKTISVKVAGTEIGRGTIGLNGKYKVTIPRQLAETELLVSQISGTDNSPSQHITVTKGIEAPTVSPVTNNNTEIVGKGTAGATISIKVDDKEIGTSTVKADGTYQVPVPKQSESTKLSIEQSKDGDISVPQIVTVITGLSINMMTINSTEINGTGVVGATITVEANNQVLGTGTVGDNGLYAIAIPKQEAGVKLRVSQSNGPVEVMETEVSSNTNQEVDDLDATSVADFGVNALDSDSMLDQSAKLQNIINKASAANKKVFIPAGNYIINSSVRMLTNTKLKGDLTQGTVLKNMSGSNVTFHATEYSEKKNIIINNLLLDGIGITARVATNISITNNIFYNPRLDFNLILYASNNAVIKSNIFMRDSKHVQPGLVNRAIYVGGFGTSTTYKHMLNTQIEGNVIGLKISEISGIKSVSTDETKSTLTKLQTLVEAKKIDVEEDEHNYITTGINSFSTLKDAKINKNFFYSNSDNVDKHGVGQDHAIYLRGSQNIDFVGNHVRGFHNGPAGGIKFKSGRNMLIMNNYFRNTGIIMYGNTEYGLGDTYTPVAELSNWLVANNTMDWKRWEDFYAIGMELNYATRTANTRNGVFIDNRYINYQNIPSNRRQKMKLAFADGVGFLPKDSYLAGNTRDDTVDGILQADNWPADYDYSKKSNFNEWSSILHPDMGTEYNEYIHTKIPMRDDLKVK